MKTTLTLAILTAASAFMVDANPVPAISGDYLEVRSCDVYTGACFANAESGLAGKEGMLIWSVRHGSWAGTALDGLKVIAVVRTEATLGDQRYHPRNGKAVVIVDVNATAKQRDALVAMAKSLGGSLLNEVADIQTASVEVKMGQCASGSCAKVTAGDLIEISTRCLGGKDHLCGNEENYYPPLTTIQDALAAYTEVASYMGTGLNRTWQLTGQRSAYLGTFSR